MVQGADPAGPARARDPARAARADAEHRPGQPVQADGEHPLSAGAARAPRRLRRARDRRRGRRTLAARAARRAREIVAAPDAVVSHAVESHTLPGILRQNLKWRYLAYLAKHHPEFRARVPAAGLLGRRPPAHDRGAASASLGARRTAAARALALPYVRHALRRRGARRDEPRDRGGRAARAGGAPGRRGAGHGGGRRPPPNAGPVSALRDRAARPRPRARTPRELDDGAARASATSRGSSEHRACHAVEELLRRRGFTAGALPRPAAPLVELAARRLRRRARVHGARRRRGARVAPCDGGRSCSRARRSLDRAAARGRAAAALDARARDRGQRRAASPPTSGRARRSSAGSRARRAVIAAGDAAAHERLYRELLGSRLAESRRSAPPITVAIVSWNTRDLLARCLESLKPDADGGIADVWVVDNASSDGSPDLVRERFGWVEPDRLRGEPRLRRRR